ncbi:MAG TPA: CHAP domain-containing protein [Candidatus Saccharimonadales bacterium]|nr:CHAP domain-containing protein [Candidatus Saccharimonadales bacterium]
MSECFSPLQDKDLEVISHTQSNIILGLGRIVTTTLLTAGLTIGVYGTEQLVYPESAHASPIIYDGLGYPDAGMPCEHAPYNATGACSNYDWGPTHTENKDDPSEYSSRGYTYRNCTDWVAYRVHQVSAGVITVPGLGNGGQWYDHAPASEQSLNAKPGEAAVEPGNPGHVAFVESVNDKDGTITVSEYNYDAKGDGDYRTGAASSMGFTEFVDFGIDPTDISGPTSPPASPPPATQLAKPAAISYNGELDVFVRGGNQIYKDSWLGDHWTGFSSLGGDITSDPVAIQYGSEMDVFATGTDGHVYKDTWNGLTWSGFNDMGGGFSGTPAVAVWGSELDLFAKGSGGTIYKDTWIGDHWTGFNSLGSSGMAANPTAITFNGELDVFARDGYGTIYKDMWNGSTWSGFNPLGGNIASSPTAVKYGQELDVYGGSGVDGQLFKDTWNGANWSGFNYMGNSLGNASTPAAISYNGEMDIYARSTNGAIMKDTWNGQFWSGLNSLGGNGLGDPATVQYGQEMDVFATDSSGHTYKDTWDGSTWSGFSFLG